MRDRMLAGDLYLAEDAVLTSERRHAARLVETFNGLSAAEPKARWTLLRELFGAFGEASEIRPPLYCDYGYRTRIGARTFANFGLVILDPGAVDIGHDVQIGPNVQLLTATHPLDPEARRNKWEFARPVSVGNNVWLGGGVIVCPGVRIGDNTVVGAGAVVTKDLPANVVAVGSPASVLRNIGEVSPSGA